MLKLKNLYFFAVAMLFFAPSILFAQTGDKFCGHWFTKGNESVVEIYQTDDKYFGKIVWLEKPNDKENGKPKIDKHNPDDSKKNDSIIGLVLLKDFKSKNKSMLDNGTVYDPNSGKTYSGNIKLKKDKLKLRGFIGISLFGRTETWEKCHKIPTN
jgi:uncharacterized protein (DUF2147 family)